MGKKFPFENAPVTHSENQEWCENYEFQREWYPFAKNTMRRSIRGLSGAWHWFDGYRWSEHYTPDRSWKRYRKHQWKVCTISTTNPLTSVPARR